MQGLQGQARGPGGVARDSRTRRDHGYMLGMRQGNDRSVPSNAGSPRVLQRMFPAEKVCRSGRTVSPSASDVIYSGSTPPPSQSPHFIAPGPMDEEPLRLRGPGVRAAARRRDAVVHGGRRLPHLLCALRRRSISSTTCSIASRIGVIRSKRIGPIASGAPQSDRSPVAAAAVLGVAALARRARAGLALLSNRRRPIWRCSSATRPSSSTSSFSTC